MKLFILIFLSLSTLYSAKVVQVETKYQKSSSCKACHLPIVKEWENSWHAKSHYKNDEYFKATINYVSKKTRKSLTSVKIECATCHNPRISVTSTDMNYEIDAVLGLNKGSKVEKATNSNAINEGINCVVCHNIDKIHDNAPETKRGIKRIEWTKSGTMTGPYSDASSPYHKVEHRDFMSKNSDKLCFVCHANDVTVSKKPFINMKSQYKKSSRSCVDCHMSSKKIGVASTLRNYNGHAKKREIREHGFKGAHTQTMWKDALSLKLKKEKNKIAITINNPNPHNIPSGFGSREIVMDIEYKKASKVLKRDTISLTQHYTSKRGKVTIPHLSVKSTKDQSIPAYGKKTLYIKQIQGTTSISVKLYYRLVNNEVRNLLKLKGKIWSKKSFIVSKSIKL